MRWVVDTNVVVSALLFRGAASELHRRWKAGQLTLVLSRDILLEYARVLAYPKFRLDEGTVGALLSQEVLPFGELVVVEAGEPVCRDPDDDKFLWCAVGAGADGLITGDDDLLALRFAWHGVPILSVSEALARLGE